MVLLGDSLVPSASVRCGGLYVSFLTDGGYLTGVLQIESIPVEAISDWIMGIVRLVHSLRNREDTLSRYLHITLPRESKSYRDERLYLAGSPSRPPSLAVPFTTAFNRACGPNPRRACSCTEGSTIISRLTLRTISLRRSSTRWVPNSNWRTAFQHP